jgi:hypothetical protein
MNDSQDLALPATFKNRKRRSSPSGYKNNQMGIVKYPDGQGFCSDGGFKIPVGGIY